MNTRNLAGYTQFLMPCPVCVDPDGCVGHGKSAPRLVALYHGVRVGLKWGWANGRIEYMRHRLPWLTTKADLIFAGRY